jgi:condensin-2 complex subunit D3
MRGLLRLLQLGITLPFGERGKMEARDAASRALSSVMESVAVATKPSARGQNETPSRRHSARRSSLGKTPGTGISKSRNRVSLDGMMPLLSPALKKKGESRLSLMRNVMMTPAQACAARPRGVSAVFLSVLQKLLAGKGLERATLRKPTVETVCDCLNWMKFSERSYFLRYALKLCHSKISSHRLVGCEIIGMILSEADWINDHETDFVDNDDEYSGTIFSPPHAVSATPTGVADTPESTVSNETHDDSVKEEALPVIDALWKALQGRLVDRAAAVRASAALSLQISMENVFQGERSKRIIQSSDGKSDALFENLRDRVVHDESATVRKTSLEAMTKLILTLPGDMITEGNILPICELCHDKSLITRKAAAESLSLLLEARTVNDGVDTISSVPVSFVEEAWVKNVLPMVLDEEIRAKATEVFEHLVVTPLAEEELQSPKSVLAFRLLAKIASIDSQKGSSKGPKQALQVALSHVDGIDSALVYRKLLSKAAGVASTSISDTTLSETNVIGSWCLMEALLSCQKDASKSASHLAKSRIGLNFCVSAWQSFLQRQDDASVSWVKHTLKSSLVVLSKITPALNDDSTKRCSFALRDTIESFGFPPESMTAAIDALTSLTASLSKTGSLNNVHTACSSWIHHVLSRCESELSAFIQSASQVADSVSEVQQERLSRALFTIGQLIMVGFHVEDDDASSITPQKDDSESDPLRGFKCIPSKTLCELVKIMVADYFPGSSRVKMPHFVRAHAFLVLGKFCLRDEKLARQSLTLLAQELHPSNPDPNPSVQSNALLVLGDLCVRYTNMTDRYLPVMASCLQLGVSDSDALPLFSSPSAIVRKHAIILLSSLLLKDYVKFRGLLFHRLLCATSDEDEEVASLAEAVLSGPLFVRFPKLFFNNFVESIFVLNKCTAHPIYMSAARQGDGGSGIAVSFDGINLSGETGMIRRRQMYNFLLSKLSDEEKIGVAARLAKEVLASAIDESGDLSTVCRASDPKIDFTPRLRSAWNVMVDTFFVLTNKALKVGKVQDDSENIEDPTIPNPARHVVVARSRLLSNISRKHLIEIVLPILCNLKNKLQSNQSPLLKDLMSYLLQIFKFYKTEAREFLANDPTLLQEIEYDARQHAAAMSQNE